MTATRYETRLKLEKLLALAARPGTPAEGEAAIAAAERLAQKWGFRIQRRIRRKVAPNAYATATGCAWCGRRLFRAKLGRPRRFCSDRCRVAAHRHRHRQA